MDGKVCWSFLCSAAWAVEARATIPSTASSAHPPPSVSVPLSPTSPTCPNAPLAEDPTSPTAEVSQEPSKLRALTQQALRAFHRHNALSESTSTAWDPAWDPLVSELVDMGFERVDAEMALRTERGQLKRAVKFLVQRERTQGAQLK